MNKLTERNIIKKDIKMIKGKLNMSEIEHDIFHTIVTEIDSDEKGFKEYVITKGELEKKLEKEFNSKNLYEAVRNLSKRVLEIREHDDYKKWEFYTLITKAKYKNGVLEIKINEEMRPMLLEYKSFIKIGLDKITKIKGKYSKRIYEAIVMQNQFNKKDPKRFKKQVKFNIEEIREIYELPKGLQRYADIKVRIFKKAIEEINKNTELEIYEIEEIKESRTVKDIILKFEDKGNKPKEKLALMEFVNKAREKFSGETMVTIQSKYGIDNKGLLYDKETLRTLDKEEAMRIWQMQWEENEARKGEK